MARTLQKARRMRSTAFVSQLAVAVTLLASGCATQTDDEFDQDAEAAASAQGGKADAPTDFVRLERTTSAEMVTRVVDSYSAELVECAAKAEEMYPADQPSTAVDRDNVGLFAAVAIHTNSQWCRDFNQLQEIVEGVLEHEGESSMSVAAVAAAIPGWVTDSLAPASATGYVDREKVPYTFFYDEVRAQQDANASAREQDPAGISFASIRSNWKALEDVLSSEHQLLNPVVLPHEVIQGPELFRYLRAAFPLRDLKLDKTRGAAITEFTAYVIGDDTTTPWSDIAATLHETSIKKRFLFVGYGDDWNADLLIVIDSHDQAWGFWAYYSE